MNSVLKARVRAVPQVIRAQSLRWLPIPSIETAPASPMAWVAEANRRIGELPSHTQDLMSNHGLLSARARSIRFFEREIRLRAGTELTALSKKPRTAGILAAAIDEIVKRKTIAQCAHAHRAGGYFNEAERVIAIQWEKVIWPIISGEDFTNTLDLACGHGRNTELLRHHAKTIDLVDINESCIAACRARFSDRLENCAFRYHLTDGNGLPTIATSSMTLVYSWDSMVHFDKLVIRDYVSEIARVLKPGGTAFLHHSNYGAIAPNSDWSRNHGNRSDMTAELMREYAASAGLSVKFQRLSGRADGWGMDDLDCLTLLIK